MSFTSHAQDQACGSSNITLNGVYLPQEWNGDFASGSGFYSGVTDLEQNEWFRQRDLDLEWNSACLHGLEETDEAAQVLTVNIKAIDGKALVTPAGFTVSFKPHTSPPSLLRLESVPNLSASSKDVAESWRAPPQHLRLLHSTTAEDVDRSQSLEDDIRELKALQAELEQLQVAISNKKKHIHAQIKKGAKSFTEELNQCDGLSCIARTIAHKANSAWRVVCTHFKPNNQPARKMGRPDEAFAQVSRPASQLSGGQLDAESALPPQVVEEAVSNAHLVFLPFAESGQCGELQEADTFW